MLCKLMPPLPPLEHKRLSCFITSDFSTSNSTLSYFFVGVTPNHQDETGKLFSVSQAQSVLSLQDEEKRSWESCRDSLSTIKFSSDEADKILSKAFGWINSPYWGEERTKEVPESSSVNDTLDNLKSLDLSDEDLFKLLKIFPQMWVFWQKSGE